MDVFLHFQSKAKRKTNNEHPRVQSKLVTGMPKKVRRFNTIFFGEVVLAETELHEIVLIFHYPLKDESTLNKPLLSLIVRTQQIFMALFPLYQ